MLLNSSTVKNSSNTSIYELLEALYRFKNDNLIEEIRNIVKDGSFSRTAPDIAIAILYFARL